MREINLNQFTGWLQGKSNMLVCITGPTGSGKSTLTSNLGTRFAYKVALPGRAVRRRPDLLAKVAKSNNPTAAPELEAFVRNYVKRKASQAEGLSLAVDGMPRTIEQVSFCIDLALDYQKTPVFVYLDVNKDERVRRLTNRGDKSDKILMSKRLESDDATLPQVQGRIAQAVFGGKYGYFFLVNTGGTCEENQIAPIEGEPFGTLESETGV